MLLAFAIGAGIAVAEGDEASEAGTPSPERTLVPSETTATSNTYRLPDGTLEAELFQAPVNYRDDQGDWQPIEEELEESAGGSITNGDNSFDVQLPQSLDSAPVRLSIGEAWLSFRPLGIATQAAELEDEIALYASQEPGVSFQFTGLADGLKEDIVLDGPDAPSTFHFLLEASSGLTPSLTDTGAVEFRDSEEQLVSVLPAPLMADSAETPNLSDDVHYELQPAAGGAWQLTVQADPEWLSSPDRVFPARIDPTVKIPAPSLDCGIANLGFSETSFCGTSGWPFLGVKAAYKSSGADEYARTLLRFNLSTIPAKASLSSATLGVYATNTASNTSQVQLFDANRNWNSKVNWNKWDGSKKWTTEGGDFGKYIGTPAVINTAQRGAQPGWWEFSGQNLTWLAQRWLTGEVPNEGVLLKLGDESNRECCITRSIEMASSATSTKPFLSVNYTLPATADSKVTSPSDGTKTAKRFLLTSAWEHSGVDGVTFQYKSPQGWIDIPAAQVIDGANQTVTWPYPVKAEDRDSKPLYWDASSLTGSNWKAKVQIRAVLAGSPGATGYTQPVEAEIDKDTGGPKDATAPIGPGSVDLLTGNFTVSRTDVSIPAFNSTLEFSRSFSSREAVAGVEATGVLGPGWKPASPVEEAGGSAWSKLKLESETETFEGESFTFKWATLSYSEGGDLAFEENESGGFITPPEMSGYVLYRLNASEIALTDPEGNRTVFSNNGAGDEYLPISVAMTGGAGNKTRMIYEIVGGKRRLKQLIAPAAPGISCPDEYATTRTGCRTLTFTYQSATAWGAPESAGSRLSKITYYAAGHGGPWDVAQYSYNTKGQLTEVWDPRISPALKETYAYFEKGMLSSVTPPGQSGWSMTYLSDEGVVRGRLKSVRRATLVESNPIAWTTIAYGVPVSGSGAPYSMGGEAVAAWGQQDLPTDATAIFPPDEVPSTPPSSYTRATVYYMDAEGQLSNVATPSGAGTSAPSITTTETDRFGNVVRELSAQNRLRALAQGTPEARVAKSRELDTQLRYSADGTELQEEKGPMHQVRLESGTTTQARLHRSIQYDKGAPTPGAGEPMPHLPTTETTGALLANGSVVDKRTTEYRYDWTLRKATETIADPGGSEETKLVTIYDGNTGLTTEMRQPSNSGGGGAGTTKVVYYKAEWAHNKGDLTACESDSFAGLPCRIEPAAQPGTSGQPQLPVKKILSYNHFSEPLEVTESPGGGTENVRKTLTGYDAAGRPKTSEIIGGGVPVPKVETIYNGSLGLPITQRIVCPVAEPGCDTQATTVTYDSLGRATSYLDADGVTTKTTYDFLGRPATTDDGKGTQTMKYDSVTGLLVELEDSAAGKFTASYDADGQLVKRGLPNGLTAETTIDEAGAPVGLAYTKASNCGLSCNWLNFAVERSITGQILVEGGTLGKNEYTYDKLGRLTVARETPPGGTCTTRSYLYDKDSNRKEMTTSPGIGGVCSSSGGSTQKYSYDAADRLLAEGLTYDSFGRITNLPGGLAGGKALSTTYFSNDMVAFQSQNGVSNTFQLDAMLRQRQRLQSGGLEGTEVFHYAGPGDSPSWTQRGSIWNRSIAGIGGELVGIQESGKEVELQLTNLHGDVSATASLSSAVTELKATFRYDEFGNQIASSPGRFGWLGGMQRRTELPSGVIQMGARSYVPQLGRFLTPDPVLRGSANPYDYAGQDPINNLDLLGEKYCNNVHGHEVCASTASKLKKEVKRYRNQYREEITTAKQMAHHHPALVVRCDCKSQKDRNIFENFVSKLTGMVKGGASSYKGAYAVVTGEGFKKAWKNASIATKWGPERLIQSWQCGWAASEGQGEKECDPIEILYGEPESAR